MLALTAALVAPYFVDWTSYRADFEREASRILGREVRVEGSAKARLLPFPSVTFTDVVVAGVEDGPPAMTVETFSMDAELAPFMRGDVHIFDMRLVRPSVTIDVAADGTFDWAVRPSVPIGAQHISVEKLTITEGKVSVRHASSGRTHRLTEINADISARALTGPWRMDGSLRLDGMLTAVSVSTGPLDADGSMRLRIEAAPERYPFTLETDGSTRIGEDGVRYTGQFRLNADPRTAPRGDAVTEEEQEEAPAYRVSGGFEFDHEALSVEEFRFETGPLEDPYTADGSARFALGAEPRFDIIADGAQIRFEDATSEAAGGVSLQTRLVVLREFLLDMPRPAIDGRIEVKLPAIVAGDTTVRDVELVASPANGGWNIASLAATLPGRSTLEADGMLSVGDTLGFDGSLLLAVAQPSGFAAWLSRDVDEAIRRLPAAGFSADVQLSEERQTFRNLELVLGAAKFRGEIDSRTPADARPSMSLRLDGDKLDVEGMAAFASLFVGEGGATRLAERDLDFEIVAGPVTVAGLTAETLDTALRLKEGTLEIDRLSIGGLANANVSATGTIRDVGVDPTGNIDATIISSDLSPLAETLRQRFPQNAVVREIVRRAGLYPGLLEDASIKVIASLAANEDGSKGLAASATGEAGGTRFTLAATSADSRLPLDEAEVTVELTARSAEAAALYALYGLPSLPLDMAGAAETELLFEGVPVEGGSTRFRFFGEGLDLRFEGRTALAQDGFSANGKATVSADNLQPWLTTAGVALPGMAFGLPAEASATLDVSRGVLVLSGIEGKVAGSTVSGDINAQMKDGLPHLTGALSLGSFDLYPVAEMAVGSAALIPDAGGWPTTPFAQKVATPVTIDLEITTEQLGLGTLGSAREARLTLRIGRQGVSVANATGEFRGGKLSGFIDFRNDGGTGLLSGQMKLTDADISRVLGDVGLSGTADLTATVTASGKSVDGVVAALAGSGTAHARDLVIDGVAPDALPALLRKAETFGPEIDATATASFAPEIVRQGRFAAEGEADIAFTIANGTVRAPPIRLETDGAAMTVDLRADLPDATVSADATLTYEAGADALVGSEPTVRFAAAGPLDDIGVLVDTDPLAQFLTQRALEREQQRVEAMQAALLEGQRHRREVRYYAALAEERERAAEEARRAAEEAERQERELRLRQEEERRAAEEAARIEEEQRRAEEQARAEEERRRQAEEAERRRQAEEAERRRIEEQTRLEEEAERRRAEEEAARLGAARQEAEEAERREAEARRMNDERFRAEVEEMLRSRDAPAATDPDAIQRAPLLPPAIDGVTPRPAPRDAPRQREATIAPPPPDDVFSERNLTIDSLMRVFRGER